MMPVNGDLVRAAKRPLQGAPVPTVQRTESGAAAGALAMALLLSHQPPQIETDRAAGKHSFAVRYGREMTVRAAWGLYLLALFSFALAAYLADQALVLGAFDGSGDSGGEPRRATR